MKPGLLIGLCMVLALLLAPLPGAATVPARQQDGPQPQIATWELTTVADWQRGVGRGLLISNNVDGELRLEDDRSQGGFISEPFETDFSLNAAGAVWRVDYDQGTDLTLELRGRATPPPAPDAPDAEAEGWGPWYELVAGDARSQADDGASATPYVVAFPPDTRYLQVRASFESSIARASAVLNELTIAYLNTTEGPPTSPGLPQVPINVGPETLTRPPSVVLRSVWSGRQVATNPDRLPPRGIILHQLPVEPDYAATLALLRAVATYQSDVLGWDDLTYHYLIDENGTLYQGRPTGPTAAVSRLAQGDTAVHVALIGNRDTTPSPEAQQTLVELVAWLGQAYDIPPMGQHAVAEAGNRVLRDNVVTHKDIVPEALGPGAPLRVLLPELRLRADRATIRSRWYFTEANNQDYTQEIALLNANESAAEAVVKLYPDSAPEPLEVNVTIPGQGRSALRLGEVVSQTTNLPVIVESSEEIIAQQTMALPTDVNISFGIHEESRVWYFAEGSTANSFNTFLVMFNPQQTPTAVTITYMRGDGTQAEQRAILPARQRLAINVGEVLPDTEFGVQIVAEQPIVAERTMRFGTDARGLHKSAGMAQLSRVWYFAEGSTQIPFNMRILLLNPNRQSTVAEVTYLTPDGTTATRRYAIPGTTRLEVNVNEFVPELGIATVIEADRPLAAERALYFTPVGVDTSDQEEEPLTLSPENPPLAGTVSAGARHPAFSWRFADATTNNTNYYLLVSNPSRGQARVTIELLLDDGSRETRSVVMAPDSRYTLPVHDLFPNQEGVSAIVRATQPIVAERSIFPDEGLGASGGTSLLGVPGP
jgi:hypothetical protein